MILMSHMFPNVKTNLHSRTTEIVPQVLATVLGALALVWSASAHTVDSNSVEGRLCTLNYKEIPPDWSAGLSEPSNALGYFATA